MSHSLRIAVIGIMLLCCVACGKRPETVDAPDGSDPKAYPHTYPDLSTDPAGVPISKH